MEDHIDSLSLETPTGTSLPSSAKDLTVEMVRNVGQIYQTNYPKRHGKLFNFFFGECSKNRTSLQNLAEKLVKTETASYNSRNGWIILFDAWADTVNLNRMYDADVMMQTIEEYIFSAFNFRLERTKPTLYYDLFINKLDQQLPANDSPILKANTQCK